MSEQEDLITEETRASMNAFMRFNGTPDSYKTKDDFYADYGLFMMGWNSAIAWKHAHLQEGGEDA